MTEPRVPIIGDDVTEVAQQAKGLGDRLAAEGRDPEGLVIHLYQMLGHSPGLLTAWSGFGRALRVETELSPGIRELAILRASLIANAMYEWSHHFAAARDAGYDAAKLAELGTWGSSDSFDELERAVLTATDEIISAYRPSDATWSSLDGLLSEREKVELVTIVSFYACVARILLSLQVPIEQSYLEKEEWIEAWTTARAGLPT